MKDENNVKVVKGFKKINPTFEATVRLRHFKQMTAFDKLSPLSFLTTQKFYAFLEYIDLV